MTLRVVCLFVLVVQIARAQEDRPVVQILGRTDADRVATEAVNSPQAVQLESAMPSAAKPRTVKTVAPIGPITIPLGTIVAWVNTFSNAPALPGGWIPCNGQMIDDPASPLTGQSVPDLNGAGGEGNQRFLRGAVAGGATGGSATHSHESYRAQKYGTQRFPVSGSAPAFNLPPYYDVIWIIRIK